MRGKKLCRTVLSHWVLPGDGPNQTNSPLQPPSASVVAIPRSQLRFGLVVCGRATRRDGDRHARFGEGPFGACLGRDYGTWFGWLTASFCSAQPQVATSWAGSSDRWGRKRAIILSIACYSFFQDSPTSFNLPTRCVDAFFSRPWRWRYVAQRHLAGDRGVAFGIATDGCGDHRNISQHRYHALCFAGLLVSHYT